MDIPKNIKALLKNENLCTMATCWENKPYLSLMNFTYLEDESKIVLSSRKNSKKYSNIQKNKNISLLIFSESNKKSVTFLGTAVIEKIKKDSYYRKLHLNKNKSPQFIAGDDIGLIIFKIEKIITADNQDQVEYINLAKK